VLALPRVVREFEPVQIENARGESYREWRVELPGAKGQSRTVVFVDKQIDGERRAISLYVQRPDKPGADKPLSQKKRTPASPGKLSKAGSGDTQRPVLQDAGRGDSSVPRTAGEATADPVRQAAAEQPDLEVALFLDQEGKPMRLTAREALEQADAEVAQAQADARAFDAAIACAIRTGDLE
jgi:hypothetical protein